MTYLPTYSLTYPQVGVVIAHGLSQLGFKPFNIHTVSQPVSQACAHANTVNQPVRHRMYANGEPASLASYVRTQTR